ncbi:MAG: sugar ABC transporter permease [Candidatus Nanopelagicales bacterium]
MSATTTAPDAVQAPPEATLGQSWRDYVARVRGGDLGALPSVLALVTLVIIFTVLKGDRFFTSFNFANLITQSATIIVLAMGLIYVLLLGEIDLSAGFAAGTSAAVLAVTLTQKGLPLAVCLVATLATGVAIGLFNGVIVAKLGIPSFVVTLAMFLALQGLMLIIIGDGGTIPVRDDFIKALMNSNLSPLAGWILYAVVVLGYVLTTFRTMESRRRAGLVAQSRQVWLAKALALAVLLGIAVFILNGERSRNAAVSIQGVPYVVIIIVALLVGLTYQLNRTSFGRHVYAVGGNAEAARRAGINVASIRIACFIACSTLAAVAGILFASKDQSVSPSTGGSTTLLYAVGAAVIGGTSLFGGRGKIRDAILGGLVVAVIGNGLPLITDASGIQFMVTGLVLLVAASVDALSRRRAQASGRA